jgi:hypothetical protein
MHRSHRCLKARPNALLVCFTLVLISGLSRALFFFFSARQGTVTLNVKLYDQDDNMGLCVNLKVKINKA